MSTYANNSLTAPRIGTPLAGFEEEIHAECRPAHPAGAARELAPSTDDFLQLGKCPVEAIQIRSTLGP